MNQINELIHISETSFRKKKLRQGVTYLKSSNNYNIYPNSSLIPTLRDGLWKVIPEIMVRSPIS